jgi:hypothetical protein
VTLVHSVDSLRVETEDFRPPAGLSVRSRADAGWIRKGAEVVEQAAWSHLGFLNYTRSHYQYYPKLLEDFADFQLCLVDDAQAYVVAAANCAPIRCADIEDLPEEGWDWAVETAAMQCGVGANVLAALAVSVPLMHRSKGYARVMIRALQDQAIRRGFDAVVVAVRPSAKAGHVNVPIEDYMTWRDSKGRVFDPWLRSHVACGGRMVRPCARSMVVEEPLAFWETWLNQRFERSGDYVAPGALAPVQIDIERRIGRYEEPNVWMAYEL